MVKISKLPPSRHARPRTLHNSATNLFLPTTGENPSCSYQGDLEEVTGWTSVPRGYTSREGLPPARGCPPFRPRRS